MIVRDKTLIIYQWDSDEGEATSKDLINSIKEVYPIHFLKVFMISFGITSLVFSYQAEAGVKEVILAIFYLFCGLVFHLISFRMSKLLMNLEWWNLLTL